MHTVRSLSPVTVRVRRAVGKLGPKARALVASESKCTVCSRTHTKQLLNLSTRLYGLEYH